MLFNWMLANPTAVLVIADIILSIFQYKKTGKISFLGSKVANTAVADSNTEDPVVMKDLVKLKEYHEKMAVELGKKISK